MAKVDLTKKTMDLLTKEGYLCAKVEKYNSFCKRMFDLYGFIDVIAIKEGETLAVQSTSRTNIAARVNKITDHENLPMVRKAGWTVHVHGWDKKDNRWRLKVVDLS